MSRLHRITVGPAVCHGTLTVRRLRYTVEFLLQLLTSGVGVDEILDD